MGGLAPDTDLEHPETSYALFAANVIGVLNTIHPILPLMVQRGLGKIAILSSLAGPIPLPDAPSYAGSKAAVLKYGLSLRAQLYDKGVKANVICPGYVSTPMTAQGRGWKPLVMSAERAALLIVRGLEQGGHCLPAHPRVPDPDRRLVARGPATATSRPFRFRVTDQD